MSMRHELPIPLQHAACSMLHKPMLYKFRILWNHKFPHLQHEASCSYSFLYYEKNSWDHRHTRLDICTPSYPRKKSPCFSSLLISGLLCLVWGSSQDLWGDSYHLSLKFTSIQKKVFNCKNEARETSHKDTAAWTFQNFIFFFPFILPSRCSFVDVYLAKPSLQFAGSTWCTKELEIRFHSIRLSSFLDPRSQGIVELFQFYSVIFVMLPSRLQYWWSSNMGACHYIKDREPSVLQLGKTVPNNSHQMYSP